MNPLLFAHGNMTSDCKRIDPSSVSDLSTELGSSCLAACTRGNNIIQFIHRSLKGLFVFH